MTPTTDDLLPLPLREGVGGRGPAAGCCVPPLTPPPPHSRPLRNGNPAGNPNLAPRCGAKNRAGCPCRAPAMPNGRCRLHGGKSTGPRTPKGIASRATANTRHGRQSAPKRAEKLYLRTLIQRARLKADARRLQAWLPKAMAARLADFPLELWAPVHPTNLPFVKNHKPTPGHDSPARLAPDADPARNAARPLPRGLAAERQAARTEAASLAPWHQAIDFARAAKRAALAANRTARASNHAALAAKRTAHQAEHTASAANRTTHQTTRTARVPPTPPARPSALHQFPDRSSLLERELAARKAGLRVRLTGPDQHPATDAPKPNSMFPRIYPVNPDTAAVPAPKPNSAFPRIIPMNPETTTAPTPNRDPAFSRTYPQNPDPTGAPSPNPASTNSRIYPMNPDNAAPARKPNSAFPRIIPMNPETAASSQPTRPTPPNAEALRTAALAALPNRAARRRWKSQQRRLHRGSAT